MKTLILILSLATAHAAVAQSERMSSWIEMMKEVSDYTLIQEGGGVLDADMRYSFFGDFKVGVSYLFIGLVDDCKPCDIELHFFENNYSSELSIPAVKYDDNLAVLGYKTILSGRGSQTTRDGRFDFYVDNPGSEFIHALLFEKKQ